MSIPGSVQEKVRRFDSALRLVERRHYDPQKPGEECMMVALERRGQDGVYRNIGWCRPDLLGDGSMLLNKLHRTDVRQYGSGQKAAKAYDEAERDEKNKRRMDRKDKMLEIGKAGYDHIKRRSGERIQNAGMPGAA